MQLQIKKYSFVIITNYRTRINSPPPRLSSGRREISEICDHDPAIYERVAQHIGIVDNIQVLRSSAVIKQMAGYSYEELTFHLEDSYGFIVTDKTLRTFRIVEGLTIMDTDKGGSFGPP